MRSRENSSEPGDEGFRPHDNWLNHLELVDSCFLLLLLLALRLLQLGNMEKVEVLLVDDPRSTTDLSCKAPILMELWWYDQRSL
ncbi:hypothetical protein RHGRI_001348 [Rhododendron griersonianum]|uniref:Uncharacterized protein n=1 Tax=Rhododendron griersonianum TaxID=479676 RepID=A0AAV6LKS7_9ERIC|nr:hypothetical protein RHGRI_001348 [Rhododendron griersonianum]